jgi:lipoate-protein ligase A
VDITVKGRKIVGSAQRRFRNVFLQQGSILIERDPGQDMLLTRFTSHENAASTRDKIENSVTSITEELGRRIRYEELVPVFMKGMVNALDISFEAGELSDLEKKLCRKLIEKKYSTEKWNYHGIGRIEPAIPN